MRNLFFIILVVFLGTLSKANVLIPFQITVNELYFAQDTFAIELFYHPYEEENSGIDSVIIKTKLHQQTFNH